MITQTIQDIVILLLAFLIFCLTFANAIYIIDTARIDPDTLEPYYDLHPTTFGIRSIDTFVGQYFLALGEFYLDHITTSQHPTFAILIFITSTFITQITIFNMLIALMGDTFSNVYENKHKFALMEKAKIYADYSAVIRQTEDLTVARYAYVMTPVVGDDEEAEWEGSMQRIKATINMSSQKVEKQVKKLTTHVKTQFAYSQTLSKSQD